MFQVPVDSTAAIAQASTVLTSSALIAYAIEALKRSKWFPWLSQQSARANHIASVVLTFVASIGIGYKFDSEQHTLAFTNVCLMCVLHGMWAWAKSYVATKVIYQGVISKANPIPVVIEPKEQPVKKDG